MLCYADAAHRCQDDRAAEADVAFMGAAAQCVYLLYGLDLPERDGTFTGEFQASPSCFTAVVLHWVYNDPSCMSRDDFGTHILDVLRARLLRGAIGCMLSWMHMNSLTTPVGSAATSLEVYSCEHQPTHEFESVLAGQSRQSNSTNPRRSSLLVDMPFTLL